MKLWIDNLLGAAPIYNWDVGQSIITYDKETHKWVDAVIGERRDLFHLHMFSSSDNELDYKLGKALLKLNRVRGVLLIAFYYISKREFNLSLGWSMHHMIEAGDWHGVCPFISDWVFEGIDDKNSLQRMLQCEEVMHT